MNNERKSLITDINKHERYSVLYPLFFNAAFAGYIIISFFALWLHSDNHYYNTAVRVLVLVSSLFLYIGYRKSKNRLSLPVKWALVSFFSFWLVRTLYEILFAQYNLDSPSYYMILLAGAVVIPFAGFLYKPSDRVLKRTLTLYFALLVLCIIFTYLNNLRIFDEVIRFRVTANEYINPIVSGHLGASLSLLILLSLFSAKFNIRLALPLKLLLLAAGLLLIILSGSRGPLLAFIFAGAIIIFTSLNRKKKFYIFALLFLISSITAFVFMQMPEDSFSIIGLKVQRLFNESYRNEIRMRLWYDTLDLVLENPFIGHALLNYHFGWYPHNLLLESLLITGIVGTAPFIYIIYRAVRNAFKLLVNDTRFNWLAVLFLQYLLFGMVSSSMYLLYQFWYLTAIMLAASGSSKRDLK